MKHTSIKLNTPCELINVTPLNPLISKCQIKVCWVGDTPNRNKSIITKEVARDLANSLPGSPIVGYYNADAADFEQHNREIDIRDGKFQLKDTTRPYGFVDLNAPVWFQKFLDDGQIEREYLMTEGWLWTGQYPECKRILDKGNNQSMELDKEIIDAYWTKDKNGDPQFFIINEAIISKLCILGEEYEPCFETANITAPKLEFSFDNEFKEQLFSMMNEIKEILNKGGAPVENENVILEEVVSEEELVETEVVEEVEAEVEVPAENTEFVDQKDEEDNEEEVCPECGKPLSECECEEEEKEDAEEDKKDKYVLEEIPEYIELQTNYAALNEKYDELVATNDALIKEVEVLTQFKLGVEKKEKEAMINSFYMLSDSDKADVITNIDTYSLDEIEAKLSIICVRNKVSFDLEEDNGQKANPTVYNLNSGDITEEATPAWVKSLQSVAKNMK